MCGGGVGVWWVVVGVRWLGGGVGGVVCFSGVCGGGGGLEFWA